jgi:hypothetical protein
MHLSCFATRSELLLLYKSGSWIHSHSRTAISTCSVMWNRPPPNSCSYGPNIGLWWMVQKSPFCTVRLCCHSEESRCEADNWLGRWSNNEDVTITQYEEVEMVRHEWLRMQEPDLHSDGIFKLVFRWKTLMCCKIQVMRRITTFRSTTGHIYDGGPIRLWYYNIIL